MAESGDLPVQTISARAGFIAEMQLPGSSTDPLDELADMIGPVGNVAPGADFAAAFFARNRNRNRGFVDVQAYEYDILHLVSPPFLRHYASQSGATLERRMPRERPPAQSTCDPDHPV